MKLKTLVFPISFVLASSAMAGSFNWTGANETSTWTDAGNWSLLGTMASSDPSPNYGTDYTGDNLRINNWVLDENGLPVALPPAVYDPGEGVTTTFTTAAGSCLVLATVPVPFRPM